MANWRCKLVFKKDMAGKIKKGDVITFPVQSNCINPTLEQLSKAVANFLCVDDWNSPKIRNLVQNSANYERSFERI